jgi:hypothetical protein
MDSAMPRQALCRTRAWVRSRDGVAAPCPTLAFPQRQEAYRGAQKRCRAQGNSGGMTPDLQLHVQSLMSALVKLREEAPELLAKRGDVRTPKASCVVG